MRVILRATVVMLSQLAVGCAAPPMASVSATAQPPAYLFRDVSVFDGTDLMEHRDVLVAGDAIQAVSPSGELPVPAANWVWAKASSDGVVDHVSLLGL